MKEKNMYPDYISITNGMRGWFAIHCRWYEDMNGYDVYQTGIGSYDTQEEAKEEAILWAEIEEISFKE